MSEFNLKSGNATPFKMMGSSPVKQKIDHVGRTVDVIHKAEMKSGDLKKSIKKDIKKVKSKTVKIKISDIKKQLKSAGSKLKLSDVKKSLTKSISKAGKFVKFIPGVGAVITAAQMMTAKSATATQPGTGKHGGTKVPKLKDIDKK